MLCSRVVKRIVNVLTRSATERFRGLVLVVLLLSGRGAAAVPLLYDELVDGDLGGSGALYPLLELDVGTNVVRGENGVLPIGTDLDTFRVFVPVGTRLVSGRIAAMDTVGDLIQMTWNLQSGPLAPSILELITVPTPGLAFFATTPLEAGTYYFFGGSWVSATHPALGQYEFQMVVARTPEPGTLALLALGLVCVGLRTDRSKRRWARVGREAGGPYP